MILDINTLLSNNQAVTATAASTGVYDTAGLGVGNPVTNIFGALGGAATVFGNDIGSGGPNGPSPPQLMVVVGTAFATLTSLTVQLQASVDDGTGNPASWKTIAATDAIPLASLTAGQLLASFTVPRRYPGQGFPRFYRCNYVVGGSAATAGTISTSAIVTGVDDPVLTPGNF